MVKMKSNKITHILYFLIGLAAIILVNQLAEFSRFRVDLTEENRYSINDATKDLLRNLEETVYIDIYLEGDLPANFKRFKTAIGETLDEFQVYSGNKVQFKFIDPSIAFSTKAKNEFYTYLAQMGIQPTNLTYQTDGKKTEKLIFPGVVISYYGEQKGVLLLKGNRSANPDDVINQSIEGIEYHIASAISQLSNDSRKRIGIIKGHGELDSTLIAGFSNLLIAKYDLYNVNLNNKKRALTDYDVLILAKPTEKFTTNEKYQLDQYIMNGGRMLAFVDALRVNLDSIDGEGTYAFAYDTDLTDLFFRYGVRINADFIQDLNCGEMPLVAGNMGDQAQFRSMPWPFFPIINNYGSHPMVKNIDASIAKFTSTIDTVKATGIKKTPLMLTSSYSRVLKNPVRVSFNDLRRDVVPENFQSGPQAISYLLEGKFTSLFKNRILPKNVPQNEFVGDGQDSKIIVVSDGDFIRNDFDLQNGNPLELGIDPYSGTVYANPDFVTNAIDYLVEDGGLISAKSKEVKIRPLDKIKVKNEKLNWQLFNMVGPLVMLIVFGLLKFYLRRRKYTRFDTDA